MKTKPYILFIALVLFAGILPTPAQLVIVSAGNQVVLSWPAIATNSVLQSTASMATPDWVDVTNAVKISNGSIVTAIPTGISPTMFFRLFTPPSMALIPAGSFTMGDNLDGESDAIPTNVYVSAFFMDTNLVSTNQWQSVYDWATNHGYVFDNFGVGKAPNHPVVTVNWYDVVKWCDARSQLAGLTPVYYTDRSQSQTYTNGDDDAIYVNWGANGFRLPTEAEWEKAARGGSSGQRFPRGNTISETQANYNSTNLFPYDLGPDGFNATYATGLRPYTSPVGSFAPNAYGLYDMAGNASEWCWDWYATPYCQPTTNNPTGPSSGTYRVVRGGDWFHYADLARCAYRGTSNPGVTGNTFGFRCVMGFFSAAQITTPQTWSQTMAPTNANWLSIASSADGSHLAAVVYSNTGSIYTSTNSGATWTQTIAPQTNWFYIASSADGSHLAAATFIGGIFTSTNFGSTWIPTMAPRESWYGIAMSADGTKLAAAINGGSIYTSTNSGSTWAPTLAPSEAWNSIASSADGTKLAAVINNGGIYTSTNSGGAWNLTLAPTNYWNSIASSANGTRLAAVINGGSIYTSTNSGSTWTPTLAPSGLGWLSIASSADGTKLAALWGNSTNGAIYSSTNSGLSWVQAAGTTTSNWQAIASSADGGRLAAVIFGGGIWTSQTTFAPSLNVAAADSTVDLSWIIPSTNFVLQQTYNLESWTDLTNTPVLNLTNLQDQVFLPITNSSGFYRLTTQ